MHRHISMSLNTTPTNQDYSRQLEDLIQAVKWFTGIIDSNQGQPCGPMGMLGYAETLALKILTGSLSAIKLYQEGFTLELEGKQLHGCDFPSVQIIARACMESYLLFYWLYIDPCTGNERQFRYLQWRASGLYLRLRHAPKNINTLPLLKQEAPERSHLIKMIISNKHFVTFKPKDRNRVLKEIKKGHQHRPSWNTLFSKAGLNKVMYQVYSYFCDYSHSGSLATIQIDAASNITDQRSMCHMPLSTIKLFIALFSWDYAELFPAAGMWLNNNSQIKERLTLWRDVALNFK